MMGRRKKAYDPAAYQAELNAKCGRAGSSWLSAKVGRMPTLPSAQKGAIREARLRIEILLDPDLAAELPPHLVPDEEA